MKLGMPWALGTLVAIFGGSALAGCLGDLQVTPSEDGGAGGAGGTGGAGGPGGAGGGNAMVCTPAAVIDCNTGQSGTCATGKATCSTDGLSLGPCHAINSSFDDCQTPDDDDCNGTPISQCTGNVEWKYIPASQAALPNDDAMMGIAATPNGKFVITGTVDGDIATGPAVNAGKFYLAEMDVTGALIWEKKFAGTDAGAGRAIAVDSAGNIVVAGDFSGNITFDGTTFASAGSKDVFIAKFNSKGDFLWAKKMGGNTAEVANSIVIDKDDNIFATGRLTSPTVDVGGGLQTLNGEDAFIVSYAPDGAYRWGHVLVNPGIQWGRGVAVAPNGDVALIGDSTGNLNFDGTNHSNGGGVDSFIAVYNGSSGNVLWSKTNTNQGDQYGRGVAALPNGNFVVVGRFQNQINFGIAAMSAMGSFDGYVVEFDGKNGMPLRQMRAGQLGTTYAQVVAADAAGHIVIHGGFEGVTSWGTITSLNAPGQDAFTVKLDKQSWEPLWLRVFTGSDNQIGVGVAVDAKGSVMTVGHFEAEIDLGTGIGKFPTSGGMDGYVVRLAP